MKLTITSHPFAMKSKMPLCLALVLGGVLFGAVPAWSESTNDGASEAYWLTNKALGQYMKLVLTRRPLTDLPSFSPPTNQTVLDCDAVIVTTYAKDSIWSIDRKPFKPLTGVQEVETHSIVINGERFACTPGRSGGCFAPTAQPGGHDPDPPNRWATLATGRTSEDTRLAARTATSGWGKGRKETIKPRIIHCLVRGSVDEITMSSSPGGGAAAPR